MKIKKDFSPTVKKLKDVSNGSILRIHVQFENYLKTKTFINLYDEMLWGEGPCYVTSIKIC